MQKVVSAERPAGPRLLPWVLAGVVTVLVAGAFLATMYARGGGPVPSWLASLGPKEPVLLAPSGPQETALRSLRLAGFDRAVVGQSGGTVVIRVGLPDVDPAGVELSWQSALAAGATAYPRAGTVVVQLFSGDVALVEVSADADSVRGAAQRDDAAALRRAARFRYLPSAGGGGR